jgi:hypothetical protein
MGRRDKNRSSEPNDRNQWPSKGPFLKADVWMRNYRRRFNA